MNWFYIPNVVGETDISDQIPWVSASFTSRQTILSSYNLNIFKYIHKKIIILIIILSHYSFHINFMYFNSSILNTIIFIFYFLPSIFTLWQYYSFIPSQPLFYCFFQITNLFSFNISAGILLCTTGYIFVCSVCKFFIWLHFLMLYFPSFSS